MEKETTDRSTLDGLAMAAVSELERMRDERSPVPRRYPAVPRWCREVTTKKEPLVLDPNAASTSSLPPSTHSLKPNASAAVSSPASPPPPMRSRPHKKLGSGPSPMGWIEIMGRIPSSAPLFLGEKKMSATDLTGHANRFLLTAEMSKTLRNQVEIPLPLKMKDMPVLILDDQCRCYEVMFSYWPSNEWFIIKGPNYGKFITNCQIEPENRVRLWVFQLRDATPSQKHHPTICFVISKIMPNDA